MPISTRIFCSFPSQWACNCCNCCSLPRISTVLLQMLIARHPLPFELNTQRQTPTGKERESISNFNLSCLDFHPDRSKMQKHQIAMGPRSRLSIVPSPSRSSALMSRKNSPVLRSLSAVCLALASRWRIRLAATRRTAIDLCVVCRVLRGAVRVLACVFLFCLGRLVGMLGFEHGDAGKY